MNFVEFLGAIARRWESTESSRHPAKHIGPIYDDCIVSQSKNFTIATDLKTSKWTVNGTVVRAEGMWWVPKRVTFSIDSCASVAHCNRCLSLLNRNINCLIELIFQQIVITLNLIRRQMLWMEKKMVCASIKAVNKLVNAWSGSY